MPKPSEANIDSAIEELLEYADLEGTEIGELWRALCHFASFKYQVSTELREALDREILTQLEFVKQSAEVVTREKVQTHKFKELVWKDET